MAYRTRENMEAILARGASVMLPGGRVATTPDQLPTEERLAEMDAELARGLGLASPEDPTILKIAADLERAAAAREQAARAQLQAQVDQLQARLRGIQPADAPAPEKPPAAHAAVPSLSPAAEPPRAPEKSPEKSPEKGK